MGLGVCIGHGSALEHQGDIDGSCSLVHDHPQHGGQVRIDNTAASVKTFGFEAR
jgi:hypothetical protein